MNKFEIYKKESKKTQNKKIRQYILRFHSCWSWKEIKTAIWLIYLYWSLFF